MTTKGRIDFLAKKPLYDVEKPFLVLLPPDVDIDPSIPRQNLEYESHVVDVVNVRGKDDYKIDECAFQYVRHSTSVQTLFGLRDIGGRGPTIPEVNVYKKETEDMLKSFLSAEHVVCYDFRLRENVPYASGEKDLLDPLLVEGPAKGAHTDVTATSGPEMIRNRLSQDDYTKYRTPEYRFRIVNTWRSLNPVCEDNPLAVCNYRSVDPEDLIAADRVIPDRAGEVYYAFHNPNQEWCWLEDQTPDEPVVFVLYDDQPGSQAKYCVHVSFEHVPPKTGVPHRRSVETRSIVISKMKAGGARGVE